MDITVYDTPITMTMFVQTLDPLSPSERGVLSRVTVPLPGTATPDTLATVQTIGSGDWSVEFPQTEPRARYRNTPARYYWGGATPTSVVNPRGAALQMLDSVVKIDVVANATVASWHRAGWSPGEPVFVPRSASQDANSDDGVVITHIINANGQLRGVVLDAATLSLVAELGLPFPKMPNSGLHCLWQPRSTPTVFPPAPGRGSLDPALVAIIAASVVVAALLGAWKLIWRRRPSVATTTKEQGLKSSPL